MSFNELSWYMVQEYLKNPVILFLFTIGLIVIFIPIYKFIFKILFKIYFLIYKIIFKAFSLMIKKLKKTK